MTEIPSEDSQTRTEERVHPAVDWWQRLRDPRRGDPGTLARLRRSRSTLEAMQVPDALELATRLGVVRRGGDGSEMPDWKVRAVLDLARVLAHVREHDPNRHPMRAAGWKRFPGRRRESDGGDERPVLSEARFRRLLLTGDGEEKVSAFTRLIALLGGTVKIDDLARDFQRWNHPDEGDRVRERWAFLYYAAGEATPALKPETSTGATTPDAEENA